MADELRKYATAAVVPIKLLLADGSGFASSGDWTPGAGDVKYSLSTDGLAFGTDTNATDLPTFSHDWWLFSFTTGELTSKITAVTIVDAALSSDAFTIETFGNASAMYAGDFSAADQTYPANFADLAITSGTGIVTADVVSINSVPASGVTTINGNLGTTQPVNFTGTSTSALVKGDAIDINSVAASSVTTINANLGTTQPVNFTGTAGSALVKGDVVDIGGAAVSATTAQVGANIVKIDNVTVHGDGSGTPWGP